MKITTESNKYMMEASQLEGGALAVVVNGDENHCAGDVLLGFVGETPFNVTRQTIVWSSSNKFLVVKLPKGAKVVLEQE